MALPTTVVLNRARQQYRNSHRGASNVHYEDEYEKLNDSLRIKWGNLMDESGRYKTSSFYKKVKCLLISWHEDCDDLKTEEEVSKLASVFSDSFNFKVIRQLLNSNSKQLTHIQLIYHIANFLMEEDAYHTLLLVYYAGHGSPRPSGKEHHGLTLTGKRSIDENPEELNEVVWGHIEDNFQHTKGDVLEIFDCCYAGDLGRTRQAFSNRSFEFLGACSSGNLTFSPGPRSFTSALIWALEVLKTEQTRFTVSDLSRKIRAAPGFPPDQVPVQLDRGKHAIERIILAPIAVTNKETKLSTIGSVSSASRGVLDLKFVFEQPPTPLQITKFGHSLNRTIWQQQMPVERIVWGSLSSWGSQPPNAVHWTVLKAVQRFKGILRKKSPTATGKSVDNILPGLQTPLSKSDEKSRSPSPAVKSQPVLKKRKTKR